MPAPLRQQRHGQHAGPVAGSTRAPSPTTARSTATSPTPARRQHRHAHGFGDQRRQPARSTNNGTVTGRTSPTWALGVLSGNGSDRRQPRQQRRDRARQLDRHDDRQRQLRADPRAAPSRPRSSARARATASMSAARPRWADRWSVSALPGMAFAPSHDLHHPQRGGRPFRHLRLGQRALSLPAVEPELRRQQRLSQPAGRRLRGAGVEHHPVRRRRRARRQRSTTPPATSPPCWARSPCDTPSRARPS